MGDFPLPDFRTVLSTQEIYQWQLPQDSCSGTNCSQIFLHFGLAISDKLMYRRSLTLDAHKIVAMQL